MNNLKFLRQESMPKPFPRVAKQFGKAVGQFDLLQGTDKVLVPIDADYPSMSMLYWLHHKTRKMPIHFQIIPVHFYSTPEPSSVTMEILDRFAKKHETTIQSKQITNTSFSDELHKFYVEAAIEFKCNKIALDDSLDYIDAKIIDNMCTHGIFDGPTVKQFLPQQNITIIRPFAFLTDSEISGFASQSEIPNAPTGVHIAEEPSMAIARQAIQHLLDESSNTRMNIFNSQYSIQKKYIGIGDGSTGSIENEDLEQ